MEYSVPFNHRILKQERERERAFPPPFSYPPKSQNEEKQTHSFSKLNVHPTLALFITRSQKLKIVSKRGRGANVSTSCL